MPALRHHDPCPACGSSDALSVYDNGTYCWSCKKTTKETSTEVPHRVSNNARGQLLTDLNFEPLVKRKLTEETCRFWGYGTLPGKQVAQYRDESGEIVAQKIRTPDKDFYWVGNHKDIQLFGRHLWRDAGKMLVITEGEIDAMSVSQIQSHKWPVVSVAHGATGSEKEIKRCIEWLERFEKVIFMFDQDEPGRTGAAALAELLSPGKAYIASLPLKDANDMLKAGRGEEVISAIWGAKQFRPDGVLCGAELFDRVTDQSTFESVPYPWECLNRLTRGIRKGEMVTVAAGTGVGKSELVRQIAYNLHEKHNAVIGYIALEESVQRTGLGFMGLHLGRRLHLSLDNEDPAELKSAFDVTLGQGRIYLYDHFGSQESDHLLNRIRYMVRGLGCDTIVLDHISIVVSGIETNDERKAIDVTMTKLRSLLEELQFRLFVVCHVRRIEGRSHEEGGQLSLSHLRGSGSIAQLSDTVIAMERDQQDETSKNYSLVRVLKCRKTGDTGKAGHLLYEVATGWLVEVQDVPESKATDVATGEDF